MNEIKEVVELIGWGAIGWCIGDLIARLSIWRAKTRLRRALEESARKLPSAKGGK